MVWAEDADPAPVQFQPRVNPVHRRSPGSSRPALDWTDPCVLAAEWQVAEAAALVRALPGWLVARTLVVPSAAPGSRLVFGKGNFRDVTGERHRPFGRWVCASTCAGVGWDGPPPVLFLTPLRATPCAPEKIKGCQDITSVFLNVERMAPPTKVPVCPPHPHVTHDTM